MSSDGKQSTAVQLLHSVFANLTNDVIHAAPMTLGGEQVKHLLQNIAR
jgi:hypothetical protein